MELTPNRGEILRYLGYHGQEIDSQTLDLLDTCMKAMADSVKPRFCYRIFPLEHGDTVFLPECDLQLPGDAIKKHLQGCRKCALLAATLGIEADNLIRISEAESMTRAVMLDACATELAEQLCDHAELEIGAIAARDGCGLTTRFSPGYGDLPMTLQSRISEILDTSRKIGLTITEQFLMIPRKSVTAILGFTQAQDSNKKNHDCSCCSMNGHCQFQKEDSACGR
ncbi:MAG: methionine synthase [Clostridia bacterium]|nr:methionine synthase [Clostridia bacterium]